MATITTSMLIILLIAGAITTLAMLSVFSNVIGHETQLHDLRNRVKELHFEHAMYIARLNARIPDEEDAYESVSELDDITAEPAEESIAIDEDRPDLMLNASTEPNTPAAAA